MHELLTFAIAAPMNLIMEYKTNYGKSRFAKIDKSGIWCYVLMLYYCIYVKVPILVYLKVLSRKGHTESLEVDGVLEHQWHDAHAFHQFLPEYVGHCSDWDDASLNNDNARGWSYHCQLVIVQTGTVMLLVFRSFLEYTQVYNPSIRMVQ